MKQLFVMISLPIVVAAVLWQLLDASPSLALYDLLVPSRPTDFAQQTIWVTGASSGIGAALVCALVKGGAQHVVLSARRVEKMHQVIQTCQQQPRQGQLDRHRSSSSSATTFSVVKYDALDIDATDSTVMEAIQSTPNQSIDILVLNSGVYQLQLALEATDQEREELARVNLHSPIVLSQALIQHNEWKERGYGQLVVVSSVMAMGPHSLCSFYAATKAALRSYFQTLSVETSAWLRVNVVLPGGTASDMWHAKFGDTVHVEQAGLMTPQRVAQLTVKAMKGPIVLFWEVWISKVEGLLYVWMSHYCPGLFYLSNHIVGRIRTMALEKYGVDAVSIPALLHILYKQAMCAGRAGRLQWQGCYENGSKGQAPIGSGVDTAQMKNTRREGKGGAINLSVVITD
eukprot:scaffold34638_cov161-Amphora_coffeaeformis.AAC.23